MARLVSPDSCQPFSVFQRPPGVMLLLLSLSLDTATYCVDGADEKVCTSRLRGSGNCGKSALNALQPLKLALCQFCIVCCLAPASSVCPRIAIVLESSSDSTIPRGLVRNGSYCRGDGQSRARGAELCISPGDPRPAGRLRPAVSASPCECATNHG